MKSVRSLAVLGLLFAFAAAPARAQKNGLEDQFVTLAKDNAAAYLMPVMDGLGHALNTGFVETARPHKVLGFDIGVRVMVGLPPASASTFTPVLPSSVTYQGFTFENPYGSAAGVETPTAVGSGSGAVFKPQGAFSQAIQMAGEDLADYEIAMPDGLDIPGIPFAVAQLSVGLPFATEVTVRMIPSVTPNKDIGAIEAMGFGGKHTITAWFGRTPIDVALFGGMQKFRLGEWLNARGLTCGMVASRSLGPLTVFGHLRRSSADIEVGYSIENPEDNPALPKDGTRMDFERTIAPNFAAGGGITLRVFGLDITGDYTHGPYPSASAKVGFSIR